MQHLLAILVFLAAYYDTTNAAIGSVPEFTVSDDELIKLVNTMRQKDNETAGFCDVFLDYGTRFTGQNPSKTNLFAKVNEELLKKGTFAKLLALRKFYNPETGVAESNSPQKEKAVNEFYDAVWESEPFKALSAFLRAKKHPWAISPNMLKSNVKQIWFDLYSRARGRLDSSAFEHVFFGEIKDGIVSGMHNWAVMYDLEKNKATEKFKYNGFYNKHFDVLSEVNLMWRGFEKPRGSFFANSSPSFDFSVLTACFLTHRGKGNKCNVIVDGCPVEVQSYDLIRDGKVFIGTSYPEMGRSSKECEAFYKKRQTCC